DGIRDFHVTGVQTCALPIFAMDAPFSYASTFRSHSVEDSVGAIRNFMERHYLHFNAREMVDAAKAYEKHVEDGGRMLMSLAGAMSTAEFGIILARMIREGKVHAISCTGANL